MRQSVDPAEYRNELGEVLDYYQHLEMMRSAGMTWEEMLATQRDWMTAESRRRAEEANGGQEVTDEALQEAHERGPCALVGPVDRRSPGRDDLEPHHLPHLRTACRCFST